MRAQEATEFVRVRTKTREVLIAPHADSSLAMVTVFDPSKCPPHE